MDIEFTDTKLVDLPYSEEYRCWFDGSIDWYALPQKDNMYYFSSGVFGSFNTKEEAIAAGLLEFRDREEFYVRGMQHRIYDFRDRQFDFREWLGNELMSESLQAINYEKLEADITDMIKGAVLRDNIKVADYQREWSTPCYRIPITGTHKVDREIVETKKVRSTKTETVGIPGEITEVQGD